MDNRGAMMADRTGTLVQDAKLLAQATLADRQIRRPAYPRLSEDLLKIWYNQQTLIVLGTANEVVLRGRSVASLLPRLLPLLTGNLPVEEIVQRVGGQPEAVDEALTLLYMQGLLEEGLINAPSLDRALVQAFAAPLKFFSRYIDYTRVWENRYAVLERLRTSSVLMIGEGPAARQALSEMLSLGLGRATVVALDRETATWQALATPTAEVQVLSLEPAAPTGRGDTAGVGDRSTALVAGSADNLDGELRSGPAPDVAETLARLADRIEPPELVLVVTPGLDRALWRGLNRLAIERGWLLLPAVIGGTTVDLGPTVVPAEGPCLECAHHQALIDLTPADEAPRGALQTGPMTPEERIGASRLALLALAALTKVIPLTGELNLYRLEQDQLSFTTHAVYRLPGCPVCSPMHDYAAPRSLLVGPDHAENWPVFFALNTNERPLAFIPKGYQIHFAPTTARVAAGAYKSYRHRPAINLAQQLDRWPSALSSPYHELALGQRQLVARPAHLTDLAWLLLLVAGRQLNYPALGWLPGQRLTPSGGNLASQSLYLLSLSVTDLPAGLYHFNQVEGQLELLRAAAPVAGLDQTAAGLSELVALNRAVPDGAALTEPVMAVLIQTAAHGRVEHKYRFKAYRYCLLDSGALAQSLATVTELMGWELWQTVQFFDDEVAEWLGLHTTTELPISISYLVRPEGGSRHAAQSF